MTRPLCRRRRVLGGCARLIATAVLCAIQLGARAQNLLLTDYRPPVSTARSLRLSLDYDYKRIEGRELENRGRLFADYRFFYDSLPFAYSIDVNATANRSDTVGFASLLTNETGRGFVWGDLFVGGEFRRQYEANGDAPDRIDAVSVLGVGYGRFINATPLAKAVRMEDWLLEAGLLVDDLPAATMVELAQVIQREAEFRDLNGETYRREWYAAMESVVRESGMLIPPSLDALALLRMDEVLRRERIFDRFFGWELSAGASRQIYRRGAAPDAPTGVELTYRRAHPVGWRTQWNARVTLSTPTGAGFRRVYGLLAENAVSYEVGDRIDLLVSHVLRADREPDARGVGYDAAATHRVHGSVVFFVENALTFSVNATVVEGDGQSRRALAATFGYRLF